MDVFTNVADYMAIGFATAISPSNILWCFVGVVLGTLIGVLPGLSALAAISLLLPVTFYLDPTPAIVMLAGIFYGSSYGGSTASILLNLPGTPSTAVTVVDGYPMARQGRAGVALLMVTVASFVGGSIGILAMMFFSPVIVEFALEFGSVEYFSLMVLGLVAASTIASGSPAKGIAMVVLGTILGLVGTHIASGTLRYTFGFYELYDGIHLVPMAMGLFGVSEVIASVRAVRSETIDRKAITFRSMIPTRDDVRRSRFAILRGAGIGAFCGALPGTGGLIAAFMSYAVEKRVATDPTRFGKGAIEGIVGPEAANNASDQTAFIPTLTLGIPGSPVMALIIGALMIQGVAPGPRLMTENPELFWGLIMSFWLGNILLVILNIPLIGIWIRVLAVPYNLLYPAILMFICIGVYSINNSFFDIGMVMVFGVIGYVMRLLELSQAPLILGLVLGPLMEINLSRSLVLSKGSFLIFVQHPLSATILGLTLVLLLWAFWSAFRRNRAAEAEAKA